VFVAAAEYHRVRPLERLDPIDVVQIAKVLNIVPHAVDEEVGRRAVAAHDDLIAVVFALMHRDAATDRITSPTLVMSWSFINVCVTTVTDCGTSSNRVAVLVALLITEAS